MNIAQRLPIVHFGRWPVKNGAKMEKTGSRKSEKKMATVFHAVMMV